MRWMIERRRPMLGACVLGFVATWMAGVAAPAMAQVDHDRPAGFTLMADRAPWPVVADQAVLPDGQAWQPDGRDVQRGYAVTVVGPSQDVGPAHVWDRQQVNHRIELWGAAGQYRAVGLAIRAIRPVEGLVLRSDGLQGETGRIGSQQMDWRVVRGLDFGVKNMAKDRQWLIHDWPLSIPQDVTAWVWVTLHLPASAAPGLYQGKITLQAGEGGAPVQELEVALRVLPAVSAVQGSWGLYLAGHLDQWPRDPQEKRVQWGPAGYNAANLGRYFAFWKTRNLNSPTLYDLRPVLRCIDGDAVADYSEIGVFAKAMNEAGLEGDLCLDTRDIIFWCHVAAVELAKRRQRGQSIQGDLGIPISAGGYYPAKEKYDAPDTLRLYRQCIEQLIDTARRQGWPRLRLMADEEMGNGGIKRITYDHFMPVLQEVAGDAAIVVDNAIGYGVADEVDRGQRDGVPVRQYNNWSAQGLAAARQDGAQVRLFNHGMTRTALGLFQQRVGSTGSHQWADQYMNIPRINLGWMFSIITDQGIVSSVGLERKRHALDDLAMMRALATLADELEAAGHGQQAAAARQTLVDITADLPIKREALNAWAAVQGKDGQIDRRLWLVAMQVQGARALLGRSRPIVTRTLPGQSRFVSAGAVPTSRANDELTLQARYADQAFALDGHAHEAVWRADDNATGPLRWTRAKEVALRALASTEAEFARIAAIPTYTQARFAYDDQGLSILIHANHTTPDQALAEHGDDDMGMWRDDCMEFFFQTDPSQAGYHRVIVNARGKRVMSHFGQVIREGAMRVATRSPINPSGGLMQELFIPWRAFGMDRPPAAGAFWRVQVGRVVHSWYTGELILCWGQVDSAFAQQERWGSVVFAGPAGPVTLDHLDAGSKYPGRNRLACQVTLRQPIQGKKLVARIVDAQGQAIAQTHIHHQGKIGGHPLTLDYRVPVHAGGQVWQVQLVDESGRVLTALPMDMPGDSARLVVNQSPEHAIDGQRFKIDLSVRLGDQDMKSARLRGTLVHAHNGQTLELAACSLGGSLRTERQVELDLRGVPAGQWRLRLWLEGTEASDRDAPQITLQVLPSPFAADATAAEPLNTP